MPFVRVDDMNGIPANNGVRSTLVRRLSNQSEKSTVARLYLNHISFINICCCKVSSVTHKQPAFVTRSALHVRTCSRKFGELINISANL